MTKKSQNLSKSMQELPYFSTFAAGGVKQAPEAVGSAREALGDLEGEGPLKDPTIVYAKTSGTNKSNGWVPTPANSLLIEEKVDTPPPLSIREKLREIDNILRYEALKEEYTDVFRDLNLQNSIALDNANNLPDGEEKEKKLQELTNHFQKSLEGNPGIKKIVMKIARALNDLTEEIAPYKDYYSLETIHDQRQDLLHQFKEQAKDSPVNAFLARFEEMKEIGTTNYFAKKEEERKKAYSFGLAK